MASDTREVASSNNSDDGGIATCNGSKTRHHVPVPSPCLAALNIVLAIFHYCDIDNIILETESFDFQNAVTLHSTCSLLHLALGGDQHT